MNEETAHADIFHGGSLAYIPKEIIQFADQIARSQNCKVVLSKESSGYQLYLPCPECLRTHRRDELKDPKYAINLSKYFAIGDDFRHLAEKHSGFFNPLDHSHNEEVRRVKDVRTGICMRTFQSAKPHRFPVSELLAMATVTARHPDIQTSYKVINETDGEERESHWEVDPLSGQMCPPPAGEITPILDLSPFHPGRWYLETYRRFDLQRLTDMFRCGFCTKEYPEGRHAIWYRKFPGGWKDTPQGRVIFHSLHNGVPLTWQGRWLEVVSDDGLTKRGLNPYTSRWDVLATRGTVCDAWHPVPPFDEVDQSGNYKFDPSKYKTAKHSARELMGWDSAIARAAADPDPIRWCVLTEGPLDGARVGPGGLVVMGKSLSPNNAAKVASNFHLVITAFDNDKAGREATDKISASIFGAQCHNPIVRSVSQLEIPSGKDLGEMDQAHADRIVEAAIHRAKQQL
jgi:hypothetical protein